MKQSILHINKLKKKLWINKEEEKWKKLQKHADLYIELNNLLRTEHEIVKRLKKYYDEIQKSSPRTHEEYHEKVICDIKKILDLE